MVLEDRFPMVALIEGTKAPDFKLITSSGSHYSLLDELKNQSLVLLAFFKVTCPVVQLEFPYLERLHQKLSRISHLGHFPGRHRDTAILLQRCTV